ncbi:MAG: TonB-dependent receptor [Lachnospiraceae bacterium]|nr:TonB-dependent receptor [Lachnospiraceae bacterium]MBR5597967.1 TonB-dependent receptor [Lachnospiraceae bacterium]
MKRNVLVLFSILMVSVFAKAQSIKGKLVDEHQKALTYANVVLEKSDSTFVAGQISDGKGILHFPKVSEGDYRLIISCMGYKTLYIELHGFKHSVNLGTLLMEEDSQQLSEVTVTATNMSLTADKIMVYPNQKQVNASANGIDLLRNLMLPRIHVNPIGNTINTNDGGGVQLCINGRKASQDEVSALQPSEIVRVELQEDPGIRYGNISVVINYVVRRFDVGGSVGYNGQQSVKSLFGRHNINGKLNFGKSEFGFFYNTEHLIFEKMWSKRNEVFAFEDGRTYHRSVTTVPHGQKGIHHRGAITYNFQNDNDYMLNIIVGFENHNVPNYLEEGNLLTEEFSNSMTNRRNWSHNRSTTPYLDIYYQKKMKNNQFLAFNAVGTYINTSNRNEYEEFQNKETIVNYYSAVNGEKFSLITEGIYEKGFNNGTRLTIGIKHTQSYTDNVYSGTLKYNTQMNQANTYAYLQYKGRIGKLNYRLGVGTNRTWFKQKDKDDYDIWSINPQFNLNYTFTEQISASLTGSLSTMTPSLSQLSSADQLIDSLQIKRGNPSLKPYDYYRLNFRLNYQKEKVNIGLFGIYNHRENPIMTHVYRENDKFIHSFANHDRYQYLGVGMNVRIGLLWNILQLSGSITNDMQWSRGVDYYHRHNSLGFSLNSSLFYKNFVFTASYHQQSDSFFGETLNTGEKLLYFSGQYRIKRINLGLMWLNPFSGQYKRNNDFLNKYAGNTYQYNIDDTARMIWATLSWNLSLGRKYKSESKRINNKDFDSGII